MRLLRLTTRQPTADFEAVYNSDIVLQPNSKIALQSVSIDSDPIGVVITADNNEVIFQINNSYSRTVQLSKRSYTTVDIQELLDNITEVFNNGCVFDVNDANINSPKILGLEWNCNRDDNNRVKIEYQRGLPNIYANNYVYNKVDFTAISAANNQYFLSMDSGEASVATFEKNALLSYPMAKGNGYLRCRTRLLNSGTNVKNGYIMGVYKDGDLTNSNVGIADILYGIRVSITSGGQRFYRSIINGVQSNAQPNMNTYADNQSTNEHQEITINGGQVDINIYRTNTSTPTRLNTTLLTYNQEDLRPIFIFFGDRATTRVDRVRFTPSPFHDPTELKSTGFDFHETGLSAPVAPTGASVSANDENRLTFQSAVVSNFLGYDFQQIPLLNPLLGGNEAVFEAVRQFNIVQEADAMLVQLMNLQVESYDSYSDVITYGNGQRTNLLAVIPSKSESGKIVYEPNERFFLDLDNKEPLYLRNLHMRILREDYSDININGLATIVVLIQ